MARNSFYTTLERVNRKWSERYVTFRTHAVPPWWAPGLILTDEIRSNYERYLPVSEFIHDFTKILSELLPSPGWIPQALRGSNFRSLPDLWESLPEPISGKVTWTGEAAWLAAFAIASPERNGTRAGRYPEQLEYISGWQRKRRALDLVVTIDYGCGTGQGTYEIANLLDKFPNPGTVIGVTREPIEAWMAANRWPPRLISASANPLRGFGTVPPVLSKTPLEKVDLDRIRKLLERNLAKEAPGDREYPADRFPEKPEKTQIGFVAGDMREFQVAQPVEIILCNGLIGGPNLFSDQDYLRLWKVIETQLAPGGLLILGNHFHDGFKKREHRFHEMGKNRGYKLEAIGQSYFYTASSTILG